jgi:hypothetical protein
MRSISGSAILRLREIAGQRGDPHAGAHRRQEAHERARTVDDAFGPDVLRHPYGGTQMSEAVIGREPVERQRIIAGAVFQIAG